MDCDEIHLNIVTFVIVTMHLNSDVLQHYSAQNMREMVQVVNCIKQGTDSPVVAIRVIIIDDDIWRSSPAHISLYKECC